jgi:methyl coenzyme M reductase gamma subunit
LSGHGRRIDAHAGNLQLRNIVARRKKAYMSKETKKLENAHFAADIVSYIRGLTPPGRFLRQDADGVWWDIGGAKAFKKVGQALHRATIVGEGKDRNASRKNRSIAQPSPLITVPEKGIGPVFMVNVNDVLSVPGVHAGNVQLRKIVAKRKKAYLDAETKKLETAYIAADIVHSIRGMTPPGRFLKEEAHGSGVWWDIGDAKAFKKVGQALRRATNDGEGKDRNASRKNRSIAQPSPLITVLEKSYRARLYT